MAAMKPRTGDGPMEAVKEGRLIIVRVPLEGGGRLVVSVNDAEAKELYDSYHVAAPGVALMQMANANLNPWTESKVDTKNPDRGPLLILDGEKDHTVPWAIANASYKRQRRNPAVTEITKIPNRGHSLTIDSGWRHTGPNVAFSVSTALVLKTL